MIRTRDVLTAVIWLILSSPRALCVQGCAAEACGVPPYRAGHIWEDTPSSIMMNISIRKADFTPGRLICLAGSLRRKYASRKSVYILMFSSPRAAKRYVAPFGGDSSLPRVNWSLQEHADYIFDLDAGKNTIYIRPFGDIKPSNFGRESSNVENRVKGEERGSNCPKVVWQ